MKKTHRRLKTEHSGAKQGGSGFYGHHADAKVECKVARRHNDKVETEDQIEDREFLERLVATVKAFKPMDPEAAKVLSEGPEIIGGDMSSFCGSDNDETEYEIGYRVGYGNGARDGAAIAFGIIGMAEAIKYRYSFGRSMEELFGLPSFVDKRYK